MITKTFKIFSYCDDFDDSIQEILEAYGSCDNYIPFTVEGKGNCPISDILLSLGAEENEEVLIHLDW